MDFSFGIFTCRETSNFVDQIVLSIRNLNIPNYEIIIVGDCDIKGDDVTNVDFNESIKPKWITKKKNIFTEKAKYENLVFLHDYISFDINWYKDFLNFGNDFKICSTRTLNVDGTRYRDWILMWDAIEGLPNHEFILPYEEDRLSKFMYINGSYWVAKKHVMEEFPLDENLVWGEGEDVVWSREVSKKYNFKVNQKSTVNMLRHNNRCWNYMSDHVYQNFVIPFIKGSNL